MMFNSKRTEEKKCPPAPRAGKDTVKNISSPYKKKMNGRKEIKMKTIMNIIMKKMQKRMMTRMKIMIEQKLTK